MLYLLTNIIERDENQANDDHLEKKGHYDPSCTYFSDKYGIESWEVIGFLFGAKDTVTKFTVNVFKCFGFDTNILQDIAIQILLDSLYILHNHLYNNVKSKQ